MIIFQPIAIIIFSLLISTQVALGAKKSPLKLTPSQLKSRVTCRLTPISHWVRERGFGKEVKIEYGKYRLVRTDIGEPDGKLTIELKSKNKFKPLCNIELSLVPDIYLSHKDGLLVLDGYSGSNTDLNIFDLHKGCKHLGFIDYTDNPKLKSWLLGKSSDLKDCLK